MDRILDKVLRLRVASSVPWCGAHHIGRVLQFNIAKLLRTLILTYTFKEILTHVHWTTWEWKVWKRYRKTFT